MPDKIGIIGAGNLGSRHLQAFSLADRLFEIYVVDTSKDSLKKAKEIFENTNSANKHKTHYLERVNQLPDQLDAVIIATNANVRCIVIQELIKHVNVQNLLLEKVLFQKIEDYFTIHKLFMEKNIKAWVNCGRRSLDVYKDLKKDLQIASFMEITVTGSMWGLGCNGIHMLDLIAFLSGTSDIRVDMSSLDTDYIESKRKGFLEITGGITGSMGKCINYSISSYATSDLPVCIAVNSDVVRCIIDESKSIMQISRKNENWNWETVNYKNPFQSERTHQVIQDILDKGTCDLTQYDESMNLHIKFQEPLIQFFSKAGIVSGICPIT